MKSHNEYTTNGKLTPGYYAIGAVANLAIVHESGRIEIYDQFLNHWRTGYFDNYTFLAYLEAEYLSELGEPGEL
jgi:hypothetical protein